MSISVVGLGKLGLPLAGVLAEAGHRVLGVDLSEDLVKELTNGRVPIVEPGLTDLITTNARNLTFSTDVKSAGRETDVTFVIVPTPSNSDGKFTSEYVVQAMGELGKGIAEKETHHLVVLVSTVMPRSCELEIIPVLETYSGRKIGNNLGFCYSPAFIALGSVIKNMKNPDFYLIGESNSLDGYQLAGIARSYINTESPITLMNIVNAEIAKLTLNMFVTMKISFANMLAEICERIPGADATTIAEAVGQDARVGVKYLRPATAYGGPCFPRDAKAFAKTAEEVGVLANLATATQAINDRQVSRIAAKINHLADLETRVGILGLAYKEGTTCIEQSVGAMLYDLLKVLNREVIAHDPMIDGPSAENVIESSDIIVITTPAKEFRSLDFGDKIVIDAWGVASGNNIIRIGKGC